MQKCACDQRVSWPSWMDGIVPPCKSKPTRSTCVSVAHGVPCSRMTTQRHVAIFGLSADPPTHELGHGGILRAVAPLVDEARAAFACAGRATFC